MSVEKVYFRFQGELIDTHVITPVNICIPKSHLEAKQDTFLSQIAGERWNSDATVGRDETSPIVVSLSECSEEWSAPLAQMITDSYQQHFDQRPTPLKLPSGGVQLIDALVVMQYFGLQVDNPETDISLEEADDGVIIRAKLFLKELEYVDQAKAFIVEYLKAYPQVETYFLFTRSEYNMDCINGISHGEQPMPMNRVKFVRVGDNEQCNLLYDWVRNSILRQRLISLLEDQVGLEANFLTGEEGFMSPLQFPDEMLPDYLSNQKDGYGSVAYNQYHEALTPDAPTDVADMGVLRVRVRIP
jgi:hypothetical protein